MINPIQLREHIVAPTLKTLSMWSKPAEDLMMGTCAVESNMGEFLVQQGSGPALGIFQMEPDTHNDIWKNYLRYRTGSANNLGGLVYQFGTTSQEMVHDLRYACTMARIKYWRDPSPIPKDTEGQAAYWKRIYNTELGAGTIKKYMWAYNHFVRRYDQPS